jgi:uncharacterized membrane protein YfcA
MLDILVNYDFTTVQWVVVILSGLSIGLEKVGIPNFLIMVPIMAQILGGKVSAGFLLPLLVMGDIFAVTYYKRHTQLKMVIKLLPWAVVGILVGLFVGNSVSDAEFKKIMAVIVFICAVMLVVKRDLNEDHIGKKWYFSVAMGLLGGFSTMIGNAAGPIMIVYFLSMNLNKNTFIGTVAWFFFAVNLIKVPLYAFVWHNITWESFSLNLILFPMIILGAVIGIRLVKFIPEKPYRMVMIAVTFISAIKLMM